MYSIETEIICVIVFFLFIPFSMSYCLHLVDASIAFSLLLLVFSTLRIYPILSYYKYFFLDFPLPSTPKIISSNIYFC